MDQMTPRISEDERARRTEQVNYALGSIRLEGFDISSAAKTLCKRYIEGELTLDETSTAIRGLHGVSDDIDRPSRRAQQKALEGNFVFSRIFELRRKPIPGNFDLVHLQATHAHLFQDLPEHQPGIIREDTGSWVKLRALENRSDFYEVPYMSEGISDRIDTVLTTFGGPDALKGLSLDEAAAKLAKLYGDLDHAHGFYEGNSRTLREFTRAFAAEAGFKLDWTGTNVTADKRHTLYAARDVEVISRQYHGVTSLTAQTREEYEATFTAELFQKSLGPHPLQDLIRSGLSPLKQVEELERLNKSENKHPEHLKPQIGRWWHNPSHPAVAQVTGFEKANDYSSYPEYSTLLRYFSKKNPAGEDSKIWAPDNLVVDSWQPISEERAQHLIRRYKRLSGSS